MVRNVYFSVVMLGLGITGMSLSNLHARENEAQAELLQEKKISKRKQRKLEKKEQKAIRSTFSHMKIDQLKMAKDEARAAKNNTSAIRILEQMVKVCDDVNELKNIMVELGDILYENQDYVRSAEMYKRLVRLYPSCDEVEYASYRAVVSSAELNLREDLDQTRTLETKELAEAFLERADVFTKYTKEVEKIRLECEERLLASEINIFNFYLFQGNIQSAQTRLETIKNEYLSSDIEDVRLRIAQLEADLTTKKISIDGPNIKVAEADEKEAIVSEQPKKFVDRF